MSSHAGSALHTIRGHAGPTETGLVLVSDCSSPFAQRAWIALEQRRIPYTYREASSDQKDTDHFQYTPNQLLPYLELPDGRRVRGSIPCIEYLADAFPSSEKYPPLWSADLVERSRERVWTDWIRRVIIPVFMRILRAKQDGTATPQSSCIDLCKNLDAYAAEIRGPFFSGEYPTLPDIVLAPFILRARSIATAHTAFASSLPADAGATPKYQQYAEAILALESVQKTSPDKEEVIDCGPSPIRLPVSHTRKIPSEIISLILKYTDDYELACTLGMPNAIPQTTPWAEQSTTLDRAILTGSLRIVQAVYKGEMLRGHNRRRAASIVGQTALPSGATALAEGHMSTANKLKAQRTFSHWGARVMVRFGYVHLLDWLYSVEPSQMHTVCIELLPEIASAWGRVEVLEWAHRGSSFGLAEATLTPRAIDDASRNGHVSVLEWWKKSGIPLVYSEDALNSATIKKQTPALEWWIESGLRLKIGNVLDFASMVKDGSADMLDWWNSKSGLKGTYTKMALYHLSCAGNVHLLDWWRESRLPLVYDKEVLIGATRYGKVQSLEWWLKSGIPITYTFFDIEEAIEDAAMGREASEQWWVARGLRQQGSAQAWTRLRALGR